LPKGHEVLDAIQLEEAVLERHAERRIEGLLRVLQPHPVEPLEQARGPAGMALLEHLHHGRHHGRRDEQELLLLRRRPLAAAVSPARLPLVLRQRPALASADLLTRVLAYERVPIEDADTGLGLVHGDLPIDEGRGQ